MNFYLVTARTDAHCIRFHAIAESSCQAASDAAELFGDEPCGITVVCIG